MNKIIIASIVAIAGLATTLICIFYFRNPPLELEAGRKASLEEVADSVESLHRSMDTTQSGDWLASHSEDGQTFAEYLRCRPVVFDDQRRKLYVLPIGDFNELQMRMVKLAAEFMEIYFGCEVQIEPTMTTDQFSPEAKRVHPRWGMRQILTTYVLYDVLKPKLPADAFAMIAFTADDLWPGDGWNFVFGQASLRGRVGVWSIYRNGDPRDDFSLCLERTLKTATHETGHMFSVEHCIAYRCNMNGSNNRGESDRHPLFMCPECLPKILLATKEADARLRFERLAAFCQKQGLDEAGDYYAKAAGRLAEAK